MDAAGYDRLVPIIAEVQVEGAQVNVRWKCPLTGREVGQSTAQMQADPSVAGRVQSSVKRSIATEVIYGAARGIAGMIGGAVGRIVSNAVYTAASDINSKLTAGSDYTEASRRSAIVAAFESVKPSFVWDEPGQRFVAR
jgi:hypothetical protein